MCVCVCGFFFPREFELFSLESQGSEANALYFYKIFVSVVRGIGQERLSIRKIQGEKFWSQVKQKCCKADEEGQIC